MIIFSRKYKITVVYCLILSSIRKYMTICSCSASYVLTTKRNYSVSWNVRHFKQKKFLWLVLEQSPFHSPVMNSNPEKRLNNLLFYFSLLSLKPYRTKDCKNSASEASLDTGHAHIRFLDCAICLLISVCCKNTWIQLEQARWILTVAAFFCPRKFISSHS